MPEQHNERESEIDNMIGDTLHLYMNVVFSVVYRYRYTIHVPHAYSCTYEQTYANFYSRSLLV